MNVIAFVNSKGGTGKSTLACSTGIAAQEAGERVYCIDLDPQGSLAAFGDRRTAEAPGFDHCELDRLDMSLTGLRGHGYTTVILDTAGVDTAATTAAMRAANLSLIPCRPSVFDLEGCRPTWTALKRLGRPFAFVLNCSGRVARASDASEALARLGLLALPPIGNRVDHVDAIGLGLGVTEQNPGGPAAGEVRELWTWIKWRMANGQS